MVFLLYQMIIYLKKTNHIWNFDERSDGYIDDYQASLHKRWRKSLQGQNWQGQAIGAFEQVPTQSAHIDLIDWSVVYCFWMSHPRIFHSYSDVTISGGGLQTLR